MEKEITRLSKFWYEYVGQDHHKDRDCHWYINKVWSYGKPPIFRVEHYGYIFHDSEPIECDTYEQAERELLALLERAIGEEKIWATRVLSAPTEWDEYQIDRAKMVMDFR